jgi:hypothetical protein
MPTTCPCSGTHSSHKSEKRKSQSSDSSLYSDTWSEISTANPKKIRIENYPNKFYHNLSEMTRVKKCLEIGTEIVNLLEKNYVSHSEDMLEILEYTMKNRIGSRDTDGRLGALLDKKYNSLKSLEERNNFIRLVTHACGADDEEPMVQKEIVDLLPPSFGRRSRRVLANDLEGRKVRQDKICTKFIEDYMHDLCR